MTSPLETLARLLARAADGSGASEEEQRTAALLACRLMQREGLTPGSPSRTSAILLELPDTESSRAAYRLREEVLDLRAEIRRIKLDARRRAPFVAAKERSRVARVAARARWGKPR